MKELYGRGKGRSMRGIASTCDRRRCRSPRPDRKRGSKLDAYEECIDVRVSEVLENCVALIVDAASSRTTGNPQLHSSAWYPRGTSVVHHTDVEQRLRRLGRAVGRHDDSDDDAGTTPQLRSQHLQREL